MPSKVVTIGYLKTFVSGILSVSTAYNDDRYCPTYAELTGGSLVTNYKSDTNPTKTTNGIRINGCSVGTSYSSNQLVVEPDLELLYQQLQSISVSAAKTTVGCCATSTTLSSTAYFKLVTKTTGGTSTASTSTSASVSASYSEDESFTSISGNKISFTKNTVNTSNCTGAPARSSEVTGSYTYSGSTKTNTVTITQSANNIDSTWTNTSTSTYDVSITPTSMSFGSAGGTKSYTVTRHYTQYQEKYDDCGTAVCFNSYNTSTTVTPSSASASGDFTCTKSNVSIGVNSGSARSGTLTVSYGGYNATCSLSQGASQAGTTNGEPYNYDYYVYVSVASSYVGCEGGTATFNAYYVTTWDYDWETKNDAGEVTNSGTSSDSSSTNVTNSATWTTTLGIVSNGVLTLGAYSEDDRRTATVKATYNGYSDTEIAYQEGCAPDTPITPPASTCMNIEYSVPVTLSSSVIVSFKDSSGAIIAAHTVPSTTGITTKEICGLTNGKALTASCSDDTVTMSGGINFNFSAGTTEYITVQAPNSGPTGSTVTSTTYTYRIDAADFDACDSETTVTVYATPTYYYSDGSNVEGEETEISVFPLPTITYRLGTGETTVTASENSTSSSRIWTVLASFRHNNSNQTASDTATQSAGPCNTGSTVYEYTFTDVTPASNSTVSSSAVGSSIHVTSTKNGTNFSSITSSESCSWLTLGSPSLSGTYYYIPFSVTENTSTSSRSCDVKLTQGESGKKVTVTITQEGKPECSCSVTSISVSPTSHTFTSTANTSFTVTINDNGCNKCDGGFKVYNSSGTYVTSGTSSFTLSNQTGTFTIKANDNTSKTCTLELTKYTPAVVYQYTFKCCNSNKQLALFASNATPSGPNSNFAMLDTVDGREAIVILPSNMGMMVNGSSNSMGGTAKIGDKVKVYSCQGTSSWTLEETITLTAANRSFEYGCSSAPTSCTCSVTSISVSPSSYTFTSRSEKKDFTVTISNNGCDKCQGYFLYNPDGIYMGSATNNAPFTLYGSSRSGNYKVVAMDNTGITKTVKVVADIPEDPVYVMQKTSGDTSTSITFPGGTTYLPYPGYICCYSTKDGVKQSVTTSSDSTWLTVSENNDLPYDGANYNFKFDQTENKSTTSRTGKITITQSGSNKKVVWTIVQAGKPNYVFKFNNPTNGFDSTSTETHIIHKPIYEGGGPTTTLTSTKDGSNIGYTMSSNVSWITTSTAATTCSWEIKKNTSSESRSGLITLTQSGSNKTMQISVTQGGAPATKTCNPLFLSYDDASHKMTATFDEMVSSDVTINFKVNVNNSAIITDSIKISEGNNSNSKTLSTSQSITSTAGTSISISSINPSSDSEYKYNCDTDWEIIPSEAPSVKCEQYKVDFDALGSWNEPGSAYVETYQKETCTDESLSININGTLQYPGGYLGTNQTFDINLVISNIACEFQFADASTNSGNLSYNGMALTMTYINPDVLLSEGSISIDATFIYNIEGETKTGSVSIWLNIMEV